jgi:hypothetical protein
MLNLENPAMNNFMTQVGQKRIEFLKSVDSTHIDEKTLHCIEYTRARINEFDDNSLKRITMHIDGKLIENEIPAMY